MSVFRKITYATGGFFAVFLLGVIFQPGTASAIDQINIPPKGESFGVEFKVDGPAPTQGARIVTPTTGQSFNTLPVKVTGTCPKDLLVMVMVNDVMAGSAFCATGSFSMDVTLYTGQNDIVARVFDNLDQEGPVSNTVNVTFNNASFSAFGTLITLTSNFARRAAAPGTSLTWPLILSGGAGPYAFSIDWGDGTPLQLKSQAFSGNINIEHVYKNAGVYQVVVKVTDTNGVSAFLQLTAVATGTPTGGITEAKNEEGPTTVTERVLLWQPAIALLILAVAAFWLGRRYELAELRKQIQRDAEKYTQ